MFWFQGSLRTSWLEMTVDCMKQAKTRSGKNVSVVPSSRLSDPHRDNQLGLLPFIRPLSILIVLWGSGYIYHELYHRGGGWITKGSNVLWWNSLIQPLVFCHCPIWAELWFIDVFRPQSDHGSLLPILSLDAGHGLYVHAEEAGPQEICFLFQRRRHRQVCSDSDCLSFFWYMFCIIRSLVSV